MCRKEASGVATNNNLHLGAMTRMGIKITISTVNKLENKLPGRYERKLY